MNAPQYQPAAGYPAIPGYHDIPDFPYPHTAKMLRGVYASDPIMRHQAEQASAMNQNPMSSAMSSTNHREGFSTEQVNYALMAIIAGLLIVVLIMMVRTSNLQSQLQAEILKGMMGQFSAPSAPPVNPQIPPA